jgi:uncharacterized membrane protein
MGIAGNRLIALVFDDPYRGEEARALLHRMGDDGLLDIDETALIVKYEDSRIRTSQDLNVVNNGQKAGHIIGLVTAAITGSMPYVLAGHIADKLVAKLTDHGTTNKFIKNVVKELQPGTSALVILARCEDERRKTVVDKLKVFGPKVIEADLPIDLERALGESLRLSAKG